MAKTVLGIGAHYDDCVFGIPGVLLKAVRKGCRVVILTLIGDYSDWKPVQGREQRVMDDTVHLCEEYGVVMRFLSFSALELDFTEANRHCVAEAVAEVGPDTAFMLWPHDSHADHEAASQLSKVALRHSDRLLQREPHVRPPRRIYLYDNGPRHTIGFEPDAFVDISEEWPLAAAWLGRLMALTRNEQYDPGRSDPAVRAKETLAAYRGHACGVRYAEALRAANAYPQEIF